MLFLPIDIISYIQMLVSILFSFAIFALFCDIHKYFVYDLSLYEHFHESVYLYEEVKDMV